MIKVAIVEDNEKDAKALTGCLERYGAENSEQFDVHTYSSALVFLAEYSKSVDIVFMDIELPDVNGLEICRRLRRMDNEVCIVFVTNMAQFAIKGYEVDAFDFVVKPLNYSEFVIKLRRVAEHLKKNRDEYVVLTCNGSVYRKNVKDIRYVEVRGHTVTYHMEQGDIEFTGSLKDAEALLAPHAFSRCNNCYLVNLRHVQGIQDADLTLVDGTVLQVSRNRRKELLRQLADFYGGGKE